MSDSRIPLRTSGEMNSVPSSPGSGPRVWLETPAVLDLPTSGKITFEFVREPITVREPMGDRKGSASVELRLVAIVGSEECEVVETVEETEAEGLEDRIDRLFDEARESENDEDKTE